MEPPAARRRCTDEDDLISGLPDEILHCILLLLPSTAAAARTSLLSHRWRHVWAHMPELVFSCGDPQDGGPGPASSVFLDSVDAAFNAYSAPTLRRLEIHMSIHGSCLVPAHRIARWLRFASRRLAGRLDLYLPALGDEEDSQRFDLPVWEKAAEIKLHLRPNIPLRLPPGGSFAALTDLRIILATMNGGELGRLVSSQCPRLRKLVVLVTLADDCDVSIHSESLVSLFYYANTGKLEIDTPFLEKISVSQVAEAYIVAPNLKKVDWRDDPYDPSRHQLVVVNRHLQRLWIKQTSMLRMRLFDTVNYLRLDLSISEGVEGYQSFLKDTDKVPVCETLCIESWTNHHAFAPTMLHLLGRWRHTRKLKLYVDPRSPSRKIERCRMLGCPCRLVESYRADNITFDSLEEIEINYFTGLGEQEKLVKFLLSRCNAETLKSLEITIPYKFVSSKIKGVCEEIRSICHRNTNVKFNAMGDMGLEPFLF